MGKDEQRKPDEWMPWFIGSYLADTTHLSRDQHGGYALMLMAMWRAGGRLRDDDNGLANTAKCSRAEWKRMRPVLEPFFAVSDGWWTQKRLAAEYERACTLSAKRQAIGSTGGKQSAAKRQAIATAKREAIGTESAEQLVQQNYHQTSKQNPTPVPIPLPTTPTLPSEAKGEIQRPARKSAKSLATPIPPDFAISERVREWAAEKGHDRLDERLEWFVSYARSGGKRYESWDDAFMNSIRGDWAKLPPKPVGSGARRLSAVGEQTAVNLEAWRRREEERDASGRS